MKEREGWQSELSVEEVRARLFPFCEEDEADGRIYFKDPVTHSRVQPGEPLACIQAEDPMCALGLETLQKLGSQGRLSISLLFGLHTSEEDMQRFVADCGGILQRSTLVAVEAAWRPEAVYVEPRPSLRSIFQRAQLNWLTRQNKLPLPCDVDWPTDPRLAGGTLRQELEKHVSLCLEVGQAPHLDDAWRAHWSRAGILAYQYIREEMMLGQLGYWLHELDEAGELSDGLTIVPFMVGSAHEPLVEKVRQFVGEAPAVYRTQPFDGSRRFAASLRSGSYEPITH